MFKINLHGLKWRVLRLDMHTQSFLIYGVQSYLDNFLDFRRLLFDVV